MFIVIEVLHWAFLRKRFLVTFYYVGDSIELFLLSFSPPEDAEVTVLESRPLRLEGEACLEFWYLSSAATNGSELRTLLKSSVGLREIWTLPALHTDAWRQVFVPLDIAEPGTQVK